MGCCQAFTVALVAIFIYLLATSDIELVLMRFFRDLSRHKSRGRLFSSEGSLTSLSYLITGNEDLLDVYAEGDGLMMTPEELSQFDGSDGRPIYLSILGRSKFSDFHCLLRLLIARTQFMMFQRVKSTMGLVGHIITS